ncbi:MAG: heat shock protein HtpX [Candidatus Dependentiae bacterium]|nr:heat shock protein HtpX [Candidatus Dependentiae bacterium]
MISINQVKTAFLFSILGTLAALLGYAFGGPHGMALALCIASLTNLLTYFYADRLVLAMYRATPLSQEKYQTIYDTVADLASHMNMPMPRLYLVPGNLPNAFATGRNPENAVVAVTEGIVSLLEPHELRGVLAHEMAHVKNRDILIGTIAATLATCIAYIADMIRWSLFWGARGKDSENRGSGAGLFIIALITPFIAMLIQLAISRAREYAADETGAECCQDPLALASALRKLQGDLTSHEQRPPSTAMASVASLCIVYPFRNNGVLNLFSTHPPLHKRIERLEKMAMLNQK